MEKNLKTVNSGISQLTQSAPATSPFIKTAVEPPSNAESAFAGMTSPNASLSYNRSMYFVETSGVSGETETLAGQIAQLAQELKESGQISETQYNAMIALANQGHRMANIQNLVEQAWLESGRDLNKFYATKLTIDGTQMGVQDVGMLFNKDTDDAGRSRFDILVQDQGIGGGEILKLRSLFKQASELGVFNNSGVKESVSNLAFEIFSKADGFQNAVYDPMWGSSYMSELVPENYSAPTHLNSSGICVVGNGISNGSNCRG